MIPVLYESTETNFQNNGIGKLSDSVVAEVEEAINGVYELFVKYPVNGAFFDEISLRSIIKAKPNTVDDPQAFRVYRITKPINGIVTIYARHLAYDLSGVAVSPFTSQSGVQSALLSLQQNMEVDSPFEFRTTKSGGREMNVSVPSSAWSLMGGTSGSLLDTYGGEWSYDNYVLTLNSRRGADNGVAIRYGKNLTDLDQDSNCANCYTGVYPYWQFEDEIVTLTEKIIYAEGDFDYTKILPLDLTERFETAPTEEQLRTAAENYIENNNIGVPDVSWKVEFVALEDTEEYKGKGFLERISLGDTVKVVFDKLGVNASARAVKTVYNVIAERYESITLGRVRSNLAQTIVEQQKEIEKKPNKSLVEKISDSLAAAIMGLNGGSVRLLDTNADGEPDTLYIADNSDPAQAVKVWRFNYEGWAASKNGYSGPFVLGATFDDGILAHMITAAHLTAGTIRSESGNFHIDLETGVMRTSQSSVFLAEDYTAEDVTKISDYFKGAVVLTDEEKLKYDITCDGYVLEDDLALIERIVENGQDCKVEVSLTVKPSDWKNTLSLNKIIYFGSGGSYEIYQTIMLFKANAVQVLTGDISANGLVTANAVYGRTGVYANYKSVLDSGRICLPRTLTEGSSMTGTMTADARFIVLYVTDNGAYYTLTIPTRILSASGTTFGVATASGYWYTFLVAIDGETVTITKPAGSGAATVGADYIR